VAGSGVLPVHARAGQIWAVRPCRVTPGLARRRGGGAVELQIGGAALQASQVGSARWRCAGWAVRPWARLGSIWARIAVECGAVERSAAVPLHALGAAGGCRLCTSCSCRPARRPCSFRAGEWQLGRQCASGCRLVLEVVSASRPRCCQVRTCPMWCACTVL
jgi:hypothetical protein